MFEIVLFQLHFVHWNEALYENYEEAARRDDGIAIIAVFVKVRQTRVNFSIHIIIMTKMTKTILPVLQTCIHLLKTKFHSRFSLNKT